MHEGERIRRIRESLGLSQKYVAHEVGIPSSTLSRIEKGKRVLSYRWAVHLARVLMCDLGAFDDGLGGPLRNVVGGLFAPKPGPDAPNASMGTAP